MGCSTRPNPSVDGQAPASLREERAHKLTDSLVLGHHGFLADLGEASTPLWLRGEYEGGVELEGATWARPSSSTFALLVPWHEQAVTLPPHDAGAAVSSRVFVQARLHGLRDGRAAVYLNGKLAGSWAFSRGETRVVVAQGGAAELSQGLNELVVHAALGKHKESAFLIDWVHVASGDADPHYAAPTRREALGSATLNGDSKPIVALRGASFARWVGAIAPGTRLKGALALSSAGSAKVVIRRLRDSEPPKVLVEQVLDAPSAKEWQPIDVEVEGVGGATEIASIEVSVPQAASGVRVEVGDLRLVEPRDGVVATQRRGTARVVLVVLGSWPTATTQTPTGPIDLPNWSSLTQRGALFSRHRASSTREGSSLASVLSGLHPSEHGVSAPGLILPKDVQTVADLARQASVPTVAFSANPTAGPAFGFSRGWDTIKSFSPVRDATVQTFEGATEWVRAHKDERFFLMVHARGGHPPWDISERDLKDLPPANYSGGLDPRRAGETLSKARSIPKHFTDADRTRAWAAYAYALRREDDSLGQFVRELAKVDDLRDTTLIVTGDVGIVPHASVPLAPVDGLDETALSIPLVVIAPGVPNGVVMSASSSVDVAATLVASLGLELPKHFHGEDLFLRATQEQTSERPVVAFDRGTYSIRWADFVVSGREFSDARFCFTRVDPHCASDVRGSYPIALEALLGQLVLVRGMKVRVAQESVFLDPVTLDQLTAWGLGVKRKK